MDVVFLALYLLEFVDVLYPREFVFLSLTIICLVFVVFVPDVPEKTQLHGSGRKTHSIRWDWSICVTGAEEATCQAMPTEGQMAWEGVFVF